MSAESTDDAPPWHDPDTLRRLYHDEGLSQAAIADRFGCASTTITEAMSRHGIEARDAGNATQEYSDADLKAFLRDLDAETDGRPYQADANARDGPCASTIRQRFGTWYEALQAAGLDYERPRRGYRETLDRGQGAWLQANPPVAAALLEVTDPFRYRDLDVSESPFRMLLSHKIITPADARPTTPTDLESVDWPSWRWEVADGVREWIEHNVRVAGTCPEPDCKSSGISNLGDGVFTCSAEGCDSRFGRETAEEVLGR
jgi:transposase